MIRLKKTNFALILLLPFVLEGQERLENEHWGVFGVGKLVTNMSNTNNIGNGQLRWTELHKYPAFEYPYNPDPDARHTEYAVGVSFHVGGHSKARGPKWNAPEKDVDSTNCMAESGDQGHYSYYKGFHFDGFSEYGATDYTAPIPLSNDDSGWPNSWPSDYPTTDPVLD
ncbi:MAG: hypothetical protein HQ510_11975, partial [Candidatus Marinimicrobia bacterium]|nr:hypothetical protein [Candidatus Neomarinimicrobiota bacterium]